MQVHPGYQRIHNFHLRFGTARQLRMPPGLLQQQLRRVKQKGAGAAGRVKHCRPAQLPGNGLGNGFPPPVRIQRLLAHRPRQPVRRVVLPKVVADVPGDDGVVQVFQRVPIGRAPGVVADFRHQSVHDRRAVIPRGVNQPGGKALRKPPARLLPRQRLRCRHRRRRTQRFRHGPGNNHQHRMAGEQIPPGVRRIGRDNKRAAQYPLPQLALDFILCGVLIAFCQVAKRARLPLGPLRVVRRRHPLGRAVDKVVQIRQQIIDVLIRLQAQGLEQGQLCSGGRVPPVLVEKPFLAVGNAGPPADGRVSEPIGRRGKGVQVARRLLLRRFNSAVGFAPGVQLARPLGLKDDVAAVNVHRPVAGRVLRRNIRVAKLREQKPQRIVQTELNLRLRRSGRHLAQLGNNLPRQLPARGSGNILRHNHSCRPTPGRAIIMYPPGQCKNPTHNP